MNGKNRLPRPGAETEKETENLSDGGWAGNPWAVDTFP